MTKIYFSYMFGLCPSFLSHRSPKPWNFPSDKSKGRIFCDDVWFLVSSSWNLVRAIKVKWKSCYSSQAPFCHNWVDVDEVTFGKYLRMGGWLPGEPTLNGVWNFRSPPPDLGGVERNESLHQSPMANELINHACVIKPP